MKFTPEMHRKMSVLITSAAESASGTKKLRLESLAYAHLIRAKQLMAKIDELTYREALPHFRAAVAGLSITSVKMKSMVHAIVGHLADAGFDAPSIQAMKPYVRRFINDVTARREP